MHRICLGRLLGLGCGIYRMRRIVMEMEWDWNGMGFNALQWRTWDFCSKTLGLCHIYCTNSLLYCTKSFFYAVANSSVISSPGITGHGFLIAS